MRIFCKLNSFIKSGVGYVKEKFGQLLSKVEEIKSTGDLDGARKLGMAKATAGLKKVDYAIFDGNFVPPNVDCESDYLVKGDEKVACISATSIFFSKILLKKMNSLLFFKFFLKQ